MNRKVARIRRADWETAPEWILPKDAPQYIARRYEVDPDRQLVQSLISAIRDNTVPHRVAGVKAQHTTGYLPAGLALVAEPPLRRIVIADWEAVELNSKDWTVGGWTTSRGRRARCPVEIWWPAVERWSSSQATRLRPVDENRAQTAEPHHVERLSPVLIETQSSTNSKHARRGRSPKYDWTTAIIHILTTLNANGIPRSGDGVQARLEREVADLFDPDDAPSESMIKRRVSETIARYRESMNGEGH